MRNLTFLIVSLLILSCQSTLDIEAEKKAIQSLIDLVDKAHYTKDADQFYKPNDTSWYDIRQGLVSHLKKEDLIPVTQSYLNDMEFQELTRRDDPIIEISDDGTLASYIGSVTVKGLFNETPVFWVVSWQSVLKKIDGEWKIISTANTEADKETSAGVLLDAVRNSMGTFKDKTSIYANADCTAPETTFKTLILSRKTDGRMEQIYGDGHLIMKHGIDSTWAYDLNSKTVLSWPGAATKDFIRGHELHWLSAWPEDRFKNPVLKDFTTYKGRDAFHLEFRDDLNRPVNFYYTFENYRPIGFEMPAGDTGEIVSVHFENWEQINDAFVFTNAIFKHNNELFQYNFIDIKFDTLEDADLNSKNGLIE